MAGVVYLGTAVAGGLATSITLSNNWQKGDANAALNTLGSQRVLGGLIQGSVDTILTLSASTTDFTKGEVYQDGLGSFWVVLDDFTNSEGYPDAIADDNFVQATLVQNTSDLEELKRGGYITVTSYDTDLELKQAYYELVDNNDNEYRRYVGSDLYIEEGDVITDVAGYVRLQGVELPCKVAIRDYPTLSGNTSGETYLELVSNFDNSGSTVATKSLEK